MATKSCVACRWSPSFHRSLYVVADDRAGQAGRPSDQVDLVKIAMKWLWTIQKLSLPSAEVIKRETFTKVLKGETMVRKFVLLKTNKAPSSTNPGSESQIGDEFPAFVLRTDFSPNRKDPLQRDVMVSNSLEQIQSLFISLRDENVKKGWKESS